LFVLFERGAAAGDAHCDDRAVVQQEDLRRNRAARSRRARTRYTISGMLGPSFPCRAVRDEATGICRTARGRPGEIDEAHRVGDARRSRTVTVASMAPGAT